MRLLLNAIGFFCLLLVCTIIENPIIGGQPVFAGIDKIKPPKDKHKLSISYKPDGRQTFPRKYNVRVGVLPMRDRRMMKFYAGSDDFFIDNVLNTINNSQYFELKFSQLFKNTSRLKDQMPAQIDTKNLSTIAKQGQVDLILVSDLVKFNLLREKMVREKNGVDYQVVVAFEFVSQLIEPRSGKILWAEHIRRDVRTLNTTGKVLPGEYTANAIGALQAGFSDMKQLILSTGLEIAR